jgi:ribose 5-phosphate isomerase A
VDGKQKVGLEAASRVRSGMIVGLGTGSTATYFIQELGRRIKSEGLAIHGVPSSFACFDLARKAGIPLLAMDQIDRVDLYADGADEVDPQKGLLKGRGAAMLGEKLLAEAADRFLVLVDEGKLVQRLGTRFPVPVETLPAARSLVEARLKALGAQATLRPAGGKDGPVVTDAGNLILDAVFPPGADWRALDSALDAQPGVVGHGLFLRYAGKSEVLVGGADGGMRIIP